MDVYLFCLQSVATRPTRLCFFHRLPPQILTVASEASAVASSSTLLSSPPTLPSAGVHADAAARAELARLARELLEAREDLQRDEGGWVRTQPTHAARCRAALTIFLRLEHSCGHASGVAVSQFVPHAGTWDMQTSFEKPCGRSHFYLT